MKKNWIILLLAAMLGLLTACGSGGQETKATEAPAHPVSSLPLAERVAAVCADAADLAPYEAADLQDMMGIQQENFTDFVFLQGNGLDGREILILKAKDDASAELLEKQMQQYLERRKEETRNYAPDAFRYYDAAKVARKSLLLVLISGSGAEAETEALLAGE